MAKVSQAAEALVPSPDELRRKAFLLGALALAGLAAACASLQRDEPGGVWKNGTSIQPRTVLPSKFKQPLAAKTAEGMLLAPPYTLDTSVVIRPRAEVREGPGAHFPLSDTLLSKGTLVLTFERMNVWQKVIVPGSWQKGWVHQRALSESELNNKPISVHIDELPTVSAIRPITKAYAFPGVHPIKVEIPRGVVFKSLMHSRWGTLVWLGDTNSVMWISRKGVR